MAGWQRGFAIAVTLAIGALAGPRLGDAQGEGKATREVAARSDIFAVLETLRKGKTGPLTELTTDAEAFQQLFTRISPETFKNGPEHLERLSEALGDGTTIRFPAGVFRVRRPLPRDTPPRDVTFTGAGLDATLLLIDEFQAGDRLQNLTLRDCTILTTGYLFDIRGALSSIQLERVRVTGFDKGSGSACVFGTAGTAIYARDSRFEGGYGRSPGSGLLFDERSSALLARFERCSLEGIRLGTRRLRPGVSVVFASCRMVDILDRAPPEEARQPGILFPETVVDLNESPRIDLPSKDLNDLFPDWEARLIQ